MLEVEGVSYSYAEEDEEVLRNVDITFPREHILAILGESGSGKTTLLKCIGRFLRPNAGTIRLDGTDILVMDSRELRKAVGIVFQKLHLFPHLTVLKNMTLAPVKVLGESTAQAEEKAMTMLAKLGIEEIAAKYPSQISGGQAQRTAIARSLILGPEYLLLDEPTSALDVDTTKEFAGWLRGLRTKTTFIIVTHDILFAADAASSGVLLSDGRVSEKGDTQTILESAGYEG